MDQFYLGKDEDEEGEVKELTLEDVGVPVVEGKEEGPAVKFEVIRDAEESSDEAPAKAAAPAESEKKHRHRSHRHRDDSEKKEASKKEASETASETVSEKASEKKDDGSVKERKHRHHHH